MYLANAVAVLPASGAAERALRLVRNTIAKADGSAQLLRACAIEDAAGLIAAFNAAREQEYGQIIVGCDDFTAQIKAITPLASSVP